MLATITGTAILAPTAQADIAGFSNLDPSIWSYNQDDTDTPVSFPDSNTIHITNQGGSQLRSVFFNTRQQSSEFTASFTYRASQRTLTNQGASFILQNDPSGTGALGGYAGGLGYSGITNSIGVTWNFAANTIGFSTNGIVAGASPIVGIDLGANNDIDFTLTYDGNFLTQRLFDTVTGVEFTQNLLVGDISSFLGDDLAYVGFGATASVSDQFLSNFSYTTVPTPGSVGILTAGLFAAARRRRS